MGKKAGKPGNVKPKPRNSSHVKPTSLLPDPGKRSLGYILHVLPVLMPRVDPAKLEAVKTLATAVGVREAARRTGIPQATVQAWSARYKWFAPTKLPPTISNPRNATIASKSPSVALADTLNDQSKQTRLNFSKSALKVSEELARMPSPQLLAPAVSVSASKWHGIASGTHGWQEKGSSGLQINLLNITGSQAL